MEFRVEQTGNLVKVRGGDLTISYEVSGVDLPQFSDVSFAVWNLMPTAMASGSSIHIRGTVDPRVIVNAEKLSQIWEMWMPGTYRQVKVSADEVRPTVKAARKQDIVFFSGGVDSTFYLLERGARPTPGFVLTIHGTDYLYDDTDRFLKLVDKTTPLLRHLNYRRVVIRTNVMKVSRPAGLMHGFMFAGCAFLLSDLFEQAVIAADGTWEEDMMGFPWGSNHVTNRYLVGSNFGLTTASAEWGRTEKVEAIAENKLARESVSFCINYEKRPHNCGKCIKCIRTKAMFFAATGSCPDIFLDNSLTEADIEGVDLTSRKEYSHFAGVYFAARARGNLGKIPTLETRFESFRNSGRGFEVRFDDAPPDAAT